MKTFTTMTAVAALIAGMSFANAQSSATNPPPSSINAGTQTGTGDSKSGAETKGTAMKPGGIKVKAGAKAETTPNNINAGTQVGTGDNKSGSETKGTAMKKTGTSKQTVGSGTADTPPPSSINAGGQTGTAGSKSGNQK